MRKYLTRGEAYRGVSVALAIALVSALTPGQLSEYEYQSLTPKHIEVITLVEGQAAVAMYYAEGRVKTQGGEAVNNYLTRATQVYVKEDGKWKVRAAHWSPIAGGSGTNQNSLD